MKHKVERTSAPHTNTHHGDDLHTSDKLHSHGLMKGHGKEQGMAMHKASARRANSEMHGMAVAKMSDC